MKRYRHVDEMERERIASMVHSGAGAAEIARALGRARSSVTRELARNRGVMPRVNRVTSGAKPNGKPANGRGRRDGRGY